MYELFIDQLSHDNMFVDALMVRDSWDLQKSLKKKKMYIILENYNNKNVFQQI